MKLLMKFFANHNDRLLFLLMIIYMLQSLSNQEVLEKTSYDGVTDSYN